MNLAALLIPPSLDPKQALRLRRFGLAALSYALATALVALAWTFGVLPASAALVVVAAFFAINLGLYAVIRTGFNLRLKDPSLTRVQILTAIAVLMYIVYHMDDSRNLALFGCFFVLLFGIHRLDAREFTLITLYTLAAYALVINLLMQFRPQAIHDVPLEWMSWLVLAGWLPLFIIIGGQMNNLRRTLRENEARFRSLSEMSSDFYWESDAEHRLTQRGSADRDSGTPSIFQQAAQIGQRRWDIPYLSPDEAGWREHRTALDAHQPFRNFEFSRLGTDSIERHISISADPVFDASGAFKGYRGVGTDISERKRSEQALLESNKQLRAASSQLQVLIQSSPLAIYTRDVDGLLTSWNPAAEKMYGWKAAEVLGKPLPSVPGEARADSDGLRRRLLAGESFIKQEARRRRRDGNPIDIDAFLGPLRDANGDISGIIAIVADITERKRAEQALRDSVQQLRQFTDNVPAITVYWDAKLLCRFANKAFAATFGLAVEDVIGKHLRELYGEDVYREVEGHFARALQGHSVSYRRTHKLASGEFRYLEVKVLPHIGDQGQILGCFAVTNDVTEHELAERALRDSAQKLRLFADNVPAMTVSYDENLYCRFANKAFAGFFGFTVVNILGKHLREVVGENAFREIEGYFARVLQGLPVTYQRTHKLANGESRHLEVRAMPNIGEHGQVMGCFAVTSDITEHKLAEERIRHVAHHDSLTGLPNRMLFNDRLEQTIRLAKRDSRQFALLYLDLDRFKPVNDTLGHSAGDELLQTAAARIQGEVRESDTVARIGGDEFTVVLPNIDRREEAETVARKIIAALAAPFQLCGQVKSVGIGTSIGIALYPADGLGAEGLVKAADAAMYRAKQSGNNFQFYQA